MKKIIVIGVIALFICVGFQPAFAVENRVSNDNTGYIDDCDCKEVSDIDLDRLEMVTEIKDSSNRINFLMGLNEEDSPECFMIIIRMMFLIPRTLTLAKLMDDLNENGILYKIIESRVLYLIQIWDELFELNVKYDCGWPEF